MALTRNGPYIDDPETDVRNRFPRPTCFRYNVMRDSIRANDREADSRTSSQDGEHASDLFELSANAAEFACLSLKSSLAALCGLWGCESVTLDRAPESTPELKEGK